MTLSIIICTITSFISALVAMAFFTLLERKVLGYIQLRKGPNKVSIAGIPQPFADALKLFCKQLNKPLLANITPFIMMPMLSLLLALILWIMYPHSASFFIKWSILFFLSVSSFNVYTTLFSGWASNSKFSLLGALRSIAQTISYEVSMALIILSPLILMSSLSFSTTTNSSLSMMGLLLWPLMCAWFITALAETNRTPFDLAEGESELVSGFNTEFSSGTFALIFMAEYMNILVMSLFTTALFLTWSPYFITTDIILTVITCYISFMFLWTRGSYPRMRYDKLMELTWKQFLPITLSSIALCASIM